MAQDISGSLGVDVDLDDGSFAEEDYGVSGAEDVILYFFGIEGGKVYLAALQAEKELCAVAECELRVLVEQ